MMTWTVEVTTMMTVTQKESKEAKEVEVEDSVCHVDSSEVYIRYLQSLKSVAHVHVYCM